MFIANILSYEQEWIAGTFQFIHEETYSLEMCEDLFILKQYSSTTAIGGEKDDTYQVDETLVDDHYILADKPLLDLNTTVRCINSMLILNGLNFTTCNFRPIFSR